MIVWEISILASLVLARLLTDTFQRHHRFYGHDSDLSFANPFLRRDVIFLFFLSCLFAYVVIKVISYPDGMADVTLERLVLQVRVRPLQQQFKGFVFGT